MLKRIETELGVEKLCIHCNEYWPLDEEFYPFQWRMTKKFGLVKRFSGVCKGYYDQHYKRRKFSPAQLMEAV